MWYPDDASVRRSNLAAAMADLGVASYAEFHEFSVTDRAAFWRDVIDRLGIALSREPDGVLGRPEDPEHPDWLQGARLNIAKSCFRADPDATAVRMWRRGSLQDLSYAELEASVMRAAHGFRSVGVERGDPVAIAMPMTVEAVTAYLALVWIGSVVVSIADSFAPDEIRARLRITGCDTVVTQDVVERSGRRLPMYDKVVSAGAGRAVVVDTGGGVALRDRDVSWGDFLGPADPIDAAESDPYDTTNVLFSSGTTGDPKAIPWTHLSPIKAAMDGHYHHDIHPGDVVAWPTNLGWMMGPWVIYASLVNRAAMALFDDAPTEPDFGVFAEEAGVTMLGVVPSIVATWRATASMEGRDWGAIRVLSSTGEASNPSDMAYLMALAGGKPIIEYCGGTEIGGGYITGTVLQPAVPSQFSTAALGIDLRILDEEGRPAANGEVFLVPPSIGMSESLLNADHHEVYFAGTPRPDGTVLRRHGDHMESLVGGYYRALGRIDDTMNLGGIKVSSAEIERVAVTLPGISEAAAVAVSAEEGGPSRLVIFVVPGAGAAGDAEAWRTGIQAEIKAHLNPLFKVHEVVPVQELPRTASNKVMRRVLRDRYGPGRS